MEWLDRLNQSISYIEDNLAGEIDFEQAAKIACCSSFHFQRMFSYIANVSLAEYIRRRRMTQAAFELQNSDIRVIDLALKYGYDSPTSFSRAFQNVHGVPPSAAKSEGVILKAHPRMTFLISIKGEVEMNYRIEKKEAFRVVGAKRHFDLDVEKNFVQVPKFWGETFQNGMIVEIGQLSNKEPLGVLGISTCMNGKDFDYYIASATDKPKPENMHEYIVPTATWAIFECIGPMPAAIQELQKRIITEWLPTSGYEYADAPDIEVYPEGDTSSLNYKCEVWLPVTKK
ncbi:MAG TPA: AraC family transcriptional regulator [Pseudobacteroides sp.]|uniref:AraC family transcriptional regulator n=1 Tax=Pseudobacteroides sp. TaxID=1968840 RepID=UPI002F936C6B